MKNLNDIKSVINYIIYSNLVVSISVGILTTGILTHFNIPNSLPYGLFTAFSTLFVYNGQRLVKIKQYQSNWLTWASNHKNWLLFVMLIAFVASVLTLFVQIGIGIPGFVLLFISASISVFYVIRVRRKSLREVQYLKIHLISAIWCLLLITFPFVNEGITDNLTTLLLLHYCYILAVAIPFDIRDLKYDPKSQKTIPQIIGVRGSKILGVVLLIVFAIGIPLIFSEFRWNVLFYLAVLIQIILLCFTNPNSKDWYCAGFIDGSIAILGLSYLI